MSRSLGAPSRSGGPSFWAGNRRQKFWASVGVLLALTSAVGAFATLGVNGHASGPGASSLVPAATHGDLVVNSGTYVIAPPNGTSGRMTYYQGGNITVNVGGTLIVRNTNLSFVQTPGQQPNVAAPYGFLDLGGAVELYNSTITTDVALVNATAFLNFTVSDSVVGIVTYGGYLYAQNSSFAYPGTFYVTGPDTVATLNRTSIGPNPAVAKTNLPVTTWADSLYAASITVNDGANLSLLHSQYTDLYADNWTLYGTPTPQPPPSTFNMNVLDSSTFSAVDSTLGINWTLAPPADPWDSNKLVLADDSTAYLANVTSPFGFNAASTYTWSSAVLPDATSHAYFYRWAALNLSGRDDVLPVVGAQLTPYYAYDSSQLDNQTANHLNALSTTVPAIWSYVEYWDGIHGITTYGTSNTNGQAFLLLAAGSLSGTTTPDGYYLGNYNITMVVPGGILPSQTFTWTTAPYPSGVAKGTPGYNSSDFGPVQTVPGYYAAVSVHSTTVLANGTAVPAGGNVRIGQELTVQVTLTDTGTAKIFQAGGSLYYNATSTVALDTVSYADLNLDAPGQTTTLNLSWAVNDTVTGLRGLTFNNTFHLSLTFNDGVPSQGGGVLQANVSVAIAPSQVRIVSFTPPSNTLQRNQEYFVTGVVQYNGSKDATVLVDATSVNGGSPIELGATTTLSGRTFEVTLDTSLLSAGTTYDLTVLATYNGIEATYTAPGHYSVPAAPSSPTNFFTQKVLGLPLWIWIVIAVAIVAAVVGFLFFARRQAAGKLVECGECGNLIPEDATVCPKCGAEFEHDLIRCSRCASTIPANSTVCPECAAQLLGTAAPDPEAQGYADFAEKYRAEAKRELGDNYGEGAFWDWWKRQPTYTSFSQWKLQQGTGTPRAGMTAPPAAGTSAPPPPGGPRAPPGASGGATAPVPLPSAPPATPPPVTGAAAVAPTGTPAGGLKACPSCGKEIPPEYLVCPFCGAVTQ